MSTPDLLRTLMSDWSDFLLRSDVDEMRSLLRVASSTTDFNRVQLARLAETVEVRIREVERQNAVLGLLVERMMERMFREDPEAMKEFLQGVMVEAAAAVRPDPDRILRVVGVEGATRTPIQEFTRPVGAGIKPAGRSSASAEVVPTPAEKHPAAPRPPRIPAKPANPQAGAPSAGETDGLRDAKLRNGG